MGGSPWQESERRLRPLFWKCWGHPDSRGHLGRRSPGELLITAGQSSVRGASEGLLLPSTSLTHTPAGAGPNTLLALPHPSPSSCPPSTRPGPRARGYMSLSTTPPTVTAPPVPNAFSSKDGHLTAALPLPASLLDKASPHFLPDNHLPASATAPDLGWRSRNEDTTAPTLHPEMPPPLSGSPRGLWPSRRPGWEGLF